MIRVHVEADENSNNAVWVRGSLIDVGFCNTLWKHKSMEAWEIESLSDEEILELGRGEHINLRKYEK